MNNIYVQVVVVSENNRKYRTSALTYYYTGEYIVRSMEHSNARRRQPTDGMASTASRRRSAELPPRKTARRSVPTMKGALLGNSRAVGSRSGGEAANRVSRPSPPSSSRRVDTNMGRDLSENGGNESEEQPAPHGSQQADASSMLETIISTVVPVARLNMEDEPNERGVRDKDDIINELKVEVSELKEERKRLIEHIEVLGVLRKEYEGKIKEMEYLRSRVHCTGIIRKKRSRTTERREEHSVELRDLCVFLESRYSRVQESVAKRFSQSLKTKKYSVVINGLLKYCIRG